jgi:hypothetical protein
LSGWDRLEPFLYRVINLDWSMPSKVVSNTRQTNSPLSSSVVAHKDHSFPESSAGTYSPPVVTPTEAERIAFLKTTTRHILSTTPDIFFNTDTQWQTITCLLHLNLTLFELSVKNYSAPAPTPPSGNRKQLPKEMRPTRLTLHCRPRRALIFRRDTPDAPEHRRARAGARVLGPLDSGAPRAPRAEASMRHVQHRAGYYSARLDRVPAPPGHRCVLVDGTHPAVSARESAGVPQSGQRRLPFIPLCGKR